MILELAEYKKYLPLQTIQNYNATITESHETRALYKWMVKYLGAALVEDIANGAAGEELLNKVKPVLANLTYFEALPFLNLVLTGSGFGIISNQNMAPASADRVRALAVGLLEAAHNFLDALLAFLENNQETYNSWNRCSLNPTSLIPDTGTFQTIFNINESRVTFIHLIPHIREVEILQLGNALSDEFVKELILGSDDKVKPLVQSACAWWAWEKMMESKTGPTERYQSSEFLYQQKQAFIIRADPVSAHQTGDAYLLQAKAYLNKNIDAYPSYKQFAYEAPFENTAGNGFFIT